MGDVPFGGTAPSVIFCRRIVAELKVWVFAATGRRNTGLCIGARAAFTKWGPLWLDMDGNQSPLFLLIACNLVDW